MKWLLDKYRKLNTEVKASFWYMMCSVITRSFGFITMPIFTRLLTTTEYGIVNIYSSWMALVSVFATLYLPYGSFGVAMQKYKDDRDRYISSVQWVLLASSLITFFGYWWFQELWNPILGLTTTFVVLMFIQMYSGALIEFWMARNRFEYKYKQVVYFTVAMSVLSVVASLLAVYYGQDKAFMKVGAGVLVGCIFALVVFVFQGLKSKFICCWKYCKYALKFNIPLIPYYLSQMLFNQSDRIMIANMVGLDKAGIYGVVHSCSLVIAFVLEAINSSFSPWFYRNLEKKKFNKIAYISNHLLVVVSIVLVMVMLISPEIIKIMAAPQYYEAVWIMPPLIAGLYFLFVSRFYGGVIFFYEKSGYLFYIMSITAVVNIGLNYALIPVYGYMVAGYTTLFAFIGVACLEFFFMYLIAKYEKFGCLVFDNLFFVKYSVFFLAVMGIINYSYGWDWYMRGILVLIGCILLYVKQEILSEILKSIRGEE